MGGLRDPKGYWRVLGITPGSDAAAVKSAYRERAKLLHPDRNPSPNAVGEFQLLGEAYRVLSDPVARSRYESDAARPREGAASPGARPQAETAA
ncbi:MAG: J domain-containing protein, partial [Cyanobacteria bacterium P01_H01_bin.130]